MYACICISVCLYVTKSVRRAVATQLVARTAFVSGSFVWLVYLLSFMARLNGIVSLIGLFFAVSRGLDLFI